MRAPGFSVVEAVHQADPYPFYAGLRATRPFGYDPGLGGWVAASAATVTAVLGDPRWRVRPPSEPVPAGLAGTAAGDVYGRLIRMTDGADQRRLRGIVVQALGELDQDRVAALARTRTAVTMISEKPLHELMFAVPVQVVGALLGLDDLAGVAELVSDFVRCIPASAGPDDRAAATRAAARLLPELSSRPPDDAAGLRAALVRAAASSGGTEDGLPENAVGLLSQTFDATAGLIGNTLVALARPERPVPDGPGPEAFVREVARHDAPVQNTRRFAAEPLAVAGQRIESGEMVLLLLAAANRDPAVNPDPDAFRPDRRDPVLFTFGAAGHRCPGETLAVTIAAAVVGELLATGWDPAGLPAAVAYRQSANARIPRLEG